MATKDGVVSVSQLSNYIKGILDAESLLKNVSVVGEVSGFKISGEHAYFSIKDAESVLACRCFYCRRQEYLPKDGDSVILTGSVSYHVKFGLSFVATKIVAYGKGALMQYYEKLKQQLLEEGLFDVKYKVEIPRFATNICVITSRTGAVIRDIYTTTRRKNPYVDITLIDVKVQGEYAPIEIVEALKQADTMGFDTIILARGGGSFEDLLPFYDERVVRAIFDMRTPIISAIGHETDFSLSDFVADYRAATPTAAAEKAVFDYWEWKEYVIDTLKSIKDRTILGYTSLNNNIKLYVDSMVARMVGVFDLVLSNVNNMLDKNYNAITSKIDKNVHEVGLLIEKIRGNDPLKLLSKGLYRVSFEDNILIDTQMLEVGDQIQIKSCQATIDAEVKKITVREDKK